MSLEKPQKAGMKDKRPVPKRRISLNNITEVAEENETQRIEESTQEQFPESQSQKQRSPQTYFRRYFTCVKRVCNFFMEKSQTGYLELDEEEFIKMLEEIKAKKTGFPILLPPQKQKKRTLVIDLDETLIHTTLKKPQRYDFELELNFQDGKVISIYTIRRFGLESFLFEMSKLYEIVIFTASQRDYADKVIDLIDPRKEWVSHRLYREHCLIINKTYYLKNLKTLGRDLQDVIMVDDNKLAALLQPENFYKIEQFTGNTKDRKLVRLLHFLKHIHGQKNILPIYDSRKEFHEMEINVPQTPGCQFEGKIDELKLRNLSSNIPHFEKQRHNMHKKKDSDAEMLSAQDQESKENEGENTQMEFMFTEM